MVKFKSEEMNFAHVVGFVERTGTKKYYIDVVKGIWIITVSL